MKTLLKILIVTPLFFLGGCYTHFTEKEFDKGRYTYNNNDENNIDQDTTSQEDSTAYNDDVYNNDNYNDDGIHNYRHYFWGYYPSNRFSLGLGYDPFYSDMYGWDCLTPGYYYPFIGYGYFPGLFYGGFYGGLYGYNHYYGYSNNNHYGFSKTFTHLRNNNGGRGIRDHSGSYTGRNGTSGRYNNGGNSGSPDLGRVRVTRGAGGNAGSFNRSIPPSRTRQERYSAPNNSNRNGSSVRSRDYSNSRRSARMAPSQSRQNSGYNNSSRHSSGGSHSSYNPGSSSSGRSGGGGGSRSSGSSGGGSRSSGSSGGGSRSTGSSDGGRTRR